MSCDFKWKNIDTPFKVQMRIVFYCVFNVALVILNLHVVLTYVYIYTHKEPQTEYTYFIIQLAYIFQNKQLLPIFFKI